jgi:hypothetical protein
MAALIVSVISREFRTVQYSTVAYQSFAVRIRQFISLYVPAQQDTNYGEELPEV